MIRKSIQGNRYGRLEVISFSCLDKSQRNSMWLCKCDCGNQKIINRSSLVSGFSKSCGCIRQPLLKDRILSKILIDQKGCWNWTDHLEVRGYGRATYNGKTYPAHRLSYMCFEKKIPKGLLVCHKCDNRRCVNPEHLYLGTHHDNSLDRGKRNLKSFQRGESHGNCKFSDAIILEVRKKHSEGQSRSQISKIYNIKYSAVCKIIRRESWNHI
jgi:hypothetical protein